LDIAEQLAVMYEIPIETFIENNLCTYFQGDYRSTCQAFISIYGNTIIQGFVNYQNADDICHEIQMCTDPTCRLFTPQQAQERAEGLMTHMQQTTQHQWKVLAKQSLNKKDKVTQCRRQIQNFESPDFALFVDAFFLWIDAW